MDAAPQSHEKSTKKEHPTKREVMGYPTLPAALALDITENQYHFSSLCGRKPSWFSATKASPRPISTQALITLAMNIELRMDQERYRRHRKQLMQFQKIVWQALIARLHGNVKLTSYSG
jgi:hypothetical protein